MPQTPETTYLLASHEPALLAEVERVLAGSGVRVEIVLSPEAALARLTAVEGSGGVLSLALIDARLPGLDLGRLLAAARAENERRFPIVLFSDTVCEELKNRLDEGVLDDLLPTTLAADQLLLRIGKVLRAQQREKELESVCEAVARNDRTDRLTGAYTRDAILSLLFRETDRVQRMNTTLCVILFDLDDFGYWNLRVGSGACDELLAGVADRVRRLLRSYDLLGRVGKDEFLAGLPGCTAINAVLLAERVRSEVFGRTFQVGGTAVRLTACFGVAPSNGRSPIIVLREAEEALRMAREAGPETIQCAADFARAKPAPVGFLSSASGDDLLGW